MNLIRKALLWLLLLPYAVYCTGVASNKLVLLANNSTFPVRLNAAAVATIKAQHAEALINLAAVPADDPMKTQAEHVATALQITEDTGMLDKVHCIMSDRTHLNLLGDVFPLHTGVFSIGDALINLAALTEYYVYFLWAILMVGKAARREEAPANV